MRRDDGRRVQAVVNPSGIGASVFWLLNGTAIGVKHFDDWTAALGWCERLKSQYWSVGWRSIDDGPPATAGGRHA